MEEQIRGVRAMGSLRDKSQARNHCIPLMIRSYSRLECSISKDKSHSEEVSPKGEKEQE